MNKDYFVTSCGKVYSYKTNKFLTQYTNQDGYYRVKINGINYSVHRLVAQKYLANPNNLPEVDHINGGKSKNYVGNLQWMTGKENIQKSNGVRVRNIETGEVFNSMADASKSVNRNSGRLSQAFKRGKNYCGGYHWEVIE